jgi:hypothetical protein
VPSVSTHEKISDVASFRADGFSFVAVKAVEECYERSTMQRRQILSHICSRRVWPIQRMIIAFAWLTEISMYNHTEIILEKCEGFHGKGLVPIALGWPD